MGSAPAMTLKDEDHEPLIPTGEKPSILATFESLIENALQRGEITAAEHATFIELLVPAMHSLIEIYRAGRKAGYLRGQRDERRKGFTVQYIREVMRELEIVKEAENEAKDEGQTDEGEVK